MLTEAKARLADDLISRTDDADYTESEILDLYEAADDRDLLKRALLYNFLYLWFFGDSSGSDQLTYRKAAIYKQDYNRAVGNAVTNVRSKLTIPKNTKHFRMVR